MIVKLPTENHLEFLGLKEGCRGSSESTLVKMSNCRKPHAAAQIISLDLASGGLQQLFLTFLLNSRFLFKYVWK